MAACVQCGTALPRGATACPQCGTTVVKAARRAAKPAAGGTSAPAARPARPVARARASATPISKATATPVVKSVAAPVAPTVKSGATPVTPQPKAAPPPAAAAPPAPKRRRAAAKDAPNGAASGREAARPAAPASPAASGRDGARPAASGPEAAGRDGARAAAAADDLAWSTPATRAEPATPSAPAATAARSADPYAAAYADVDAVTDPVARATALAPDPAAPPAVPEEGFAAPGTTAPRRPTRRRPWAGGDVIGEADERDPYDPVVVTEPLDEAPLPPAIEERFDQDPVPDRGWPLALRIVRGDWLPSLAAALPAFVATFLVAAVATGSLLVATRPEGDDLLVGNTSAGRWLDYVCAAVGMAFGGRLFVGNDAGGEEDFTFGYAIRFVPLTVTALALVALWFFARRAHQRNVTPDRLPDALRTAFVYAAGVALVSRFARWSALESSDGDDFFRGPEFVTTFAVSPWEPFFWAFCAAFAVAWLAGGRLVATGRWAGWLLAARGALVGLGAGVAASLLLLLVLAYTYADKAGAQSSDVTNGLPLALAYALGFGAAAFGVLSGGRLYVPVSEHGKWDLLSPWLPGAMPVLLVIPALAVAVGAWYVLRRPGVPRAEALRACGRMGLPAAVAWFAVALAGSPSVAQSASFGPAGTLTAGPVLWGALIVGLWFSAGGRLAGWVLARLADRAAARPADDLDDFDDLDYAGEPFDQPVAAP